ncbi:MAG: hypothetical protein ACI4S2_12510 [Lachnospiraceae bacterium]
MATLEEMYEDIPIGRQNAISKYELARIWNIRSERAVRARIEKMRAIDNGDGFVIVSLSSGRGFYRTDDIKEITAYKNETTNRARHTFAPLKKVNRILMESDMQQLELVPPNRLKEAREAAGLQAKQVISIIQQHDPSFNKVTMSLIENNKALPTALQLSVMSRLYKSTPAELIGMDLVNSPVTV